MDSSTFGMLAALVLNLFSSVAGVKSKMLRKKSQHGTGQGRSALLIHTP
jgi:hypothetical protein